MSVDLSVLILTYNEAVHIERAIASVSSIAREVVVVDSGSTDGTAELAERAGARVLHHPFISHAHSVRWGLEHAGLISTWIMRLDADEVIEPQLANEIIARLPLLEAPVNGVNLKRKHIFMGRFVRHGGRYPLVLLRIWRSGTAQVEDRWMDEHVFLRVGQSVDFDQPFSDVNLRDLSFFTNKHNNYATREAIEVLSARYNLFERDDLRDVSSPKQAQFKRLLKERVYNHVPFYLSSLIYFLYRYIIRMGFLDGVEGLVYHALQGGWYRFLVGSRTLELDRSLAPLNTRSARIEELSRLTGIALPD